MASYSETSYYERLASVLPERGFTANSENSRPRVLIVPNAASWIVGQMAGHIMRRFSDRYEFWFMTDKMIRLRPDVVRALAPEIDFAFPLTDKGYHLIHKAIYPEKLPSLLWLHHVTNWTPAIREAVEASKELIACTGEWKQEVANHARADLPITVVPHGVDPDAFQRRPAQRSKYGMPTHAFVVGFVGSKTSNYDAGRKGLDTLERVLQQIRDRIPNLHVSFLGLGWEEEVSKLRGEGISANYVGFVPESQLPDFYSSIDTYLLTSRVEGGPCTVLESMACETPVVATRVGLVPQTIRDGVNGFSTGIDDADTLAAAIVQLYSSPDVAKQMGAAARAVVTDSLSWNHTLSNLEGPLARMEKLSMRRSRFSSDVSGEYARSLARAVHTADGTLWGVVSWWQGLISPGTSRRLVKACCEGYGAADLLRGMGLVTRVAFRPSSLRKNLQAEVPAKAA
jgi:glycosyltransferase involved in cell wall biosynthesis